MLVWGRRLWVQSNYTLMNGECDKMDFRAYSPMRPFSFSSIVSPFPQKRPYWIVSPFCWNRRDMTNSLKWREVMLVAMDEALEKHFQPMSWGDKITGVYCFAHFFQAVSTDYLLELWISGRIDGSISNENASTIQIPLAGGNALHKGFSPSDLKTNQT